MLCGGFSQEKKFDEECKKVIDAIKDNLNYDIINTISYKTQVVNGINYLIKNKINHEDFYFIKVHKSLNNEFKLLEHYLKKNF